MDCLGRACLCEYKNNGQVSMGFTFPRDMPDDEESLWLTTTDYYPKPKTNKSPALSCNFSTGGVDGRKPSKVVVNSLRSTYCKG